MSKTGDAMQNLENAEKIEEGKSKTVGGGEAPSHRKGEDPLTSRGFSFTRLFRGILEKDWDHAKPEREVSKILKDEGYKTRDSGELVPFNPVATYRVHGDELTDFGKNEREFSTFMKREYSKRVTTEKDNVGSLVEPEQADDFIDLLRNESVVEEAGARVLDLPQSGQLNVPKMKGGATAYWRAENEALTAEDINVGDVALRSKYLSCLVQVSKESLRHSTPSLEEMIREDMSREMALKEDETFIYGTAASEGAAGSDIPEGLMDYDIKTKSLALNDKNHVIDIEAALNQVEPTAWLMNKNERGTILKVEDTNGNSVFLGNFSEGGAFPGQLLQIPVIVTEQLSNNDLFIGDWRQAMIARDMVMEISSTDQAGTAFKQNQMWFKTNLGVDFGIRHEDAFLYNDST